MVPSLSLAPHGRALTLLLSFGCGLTRRLVPAAATHAVGVVPAQVLRLQLRSSRRSSSKGRSRLTHSKERRSSKGKGRHTRYPACALKTRWCCLQRG